MPELTKVQTGFLEPQGPFKLDAGTAGAPGLYFEGDASTGLYRSAEDEIALSVNGSQKLKFTETGLNFNGTSLDGTPFVGKIDKTLTDTATDIFIYDTSKDSDGGAWRKRVQHTTWYNESLNTATRGSRRDFPSVAVIVLQSTTMTIYDGDDPSLPMWMVFNRGTDTQVTMWWDGNNANTGVTIDALNGFILMGTSNAGAYGVDFIGERWLYLYNASTLCGWRYNTDIVNRNLAVSGRNVVYSLGSGTGATVNDVRIFALPNAPIDTYTGLPTPTLALACEQGFYLIRDKNINGGSFQETYSSYINRKLGGNKELLFRADVSNGGYYGISLNSLNSSAYFSTIGNLRLLNNVNSTTTNLIEVPDKTTLYSGQTVGLSIINQDFSTGNSYDGSVCHIKTNYNSGWMYGNIMGSWLNDASTVTTTPVGTNIITNGDGTSTVGWTVNPASNTLSIDSGRLKCVSSIADGAYFGQSFSVEAGKTYQIQVTSINDGTSKTVRTYLGTVNGSGDIFSGPDGFIFGTTLFYYTATVSRTIWLWFYGSSGGNGTYILVDDVSVRLAEPNRAIKSSHSRGLGIFGTLTRSPVATNSNLTAYSGFGSSNYLQQPYSSDLLLGTGDFSIMFWMKTSRTSASNYGDILTLGDLGAFAYGSATRYILFQINGNNAGQSRLLLYYKNSVEASSFNIYTFSPNIWMHVALIRKDNNMTLYLNGYPIENRICTGSFSPSTTPDQNFTLKAGHSGSNYSYPATQESISLLKISQTAPNSQQLLKIYTDEKLLFEPNVNCNLYGTSDSITGLSFDNVTKKLHVGTSSGRSDFMGIARINNTTTAVTTAISAYDGFVVEQ